jgi:hypothetical protein
MRDASGQRLAKRHDALSIRRLRDSGLTADQVRKMALSAQSEAAG